VGQKNEQKPANFDSLGLGGIWMSHPSKATSL